MFVGSDNSRPSYGDNLSRATEFDGGDTKLELRTGDAGHVTRIRRDPFVCELFFPPGVLTKQDTWNFAVRFELA